MPAANVTVTFTGGDPNSLTMKLNGSNAQSITTSGTYTYPNVAQFDKISLQGTALATTTISIDRSTTPANPTTFPPGPVFIIYTINN